MRFRFKSIGALAAAALLLGLSAPSVAQTEAQTEPGAPADGEAAVVVELNKVEQLDNACRAYLLFENGNSSRFDEFRLDLVLFDSEGVIARPLQMGPELFTQPCVGEQFILTVSGKSANSSAKAS
ncbi:hypothetical protein [Aquibaculum arenosum]|uniref:Tat pathway signal sequence domain protein n=1 Tax=Aquibaculum arenosum TaxID=3032591 RepID=A0ABT5YMX6_9PROT|nr:hypothetical protein [Fodinicurvata sp. CAU 1616]MDF2096115.1 hypothetical protein [Fodinicurvata sp. CAU 1616]